MAKNWLLKEAAQVYLEGVDTAAIMDIGGRFPLLADLLSRALGGNEQQAAATFALLKATPDKLTAGIMHAKLKEGVGEVSEDTAEPDEEKATEKKADKKPAKEEKKAESNGDDDYESKGAYPLYQLCKERGIEVKSKQPKEVYIKALRDADGNDGAEDSGAEDDGWNEVEDEKDYSKMSAKKLYSECKDRGLKVEPKKAAKDYIKLLKADDEKASQDASEDDGWGDDDGAKEDKKSSKGNKPKKEEDNWDI